jgi:phage tail sheath protein FI
MPLAPTYPGIYVEEIPVDMKSIPGVATSVAAFIGRAGAGPLNQPVQLASFGDYERRFGCLDGASPMGYAVRDFYLNGGSIAVVVRVLHDDARPATITLNSSGSETPLVLEATNPGAWGNRLSAAVEYETVGALPSPSVEDNRFTLTVRYRTQPEVSQFATEVFRAVSLAEDDACFLPRVLEIESSLVRVQASARPPIRPAITVTQDNGERTVNWVDADADSGADGSEIDDKDIIGEKESQTGIYALNRVDLFNLLCIPPRIRNLSTEPPTYTATSAAVYRAALAFCVERRAMLIVDPDPAWAGSRPSAVSNAIEGRNALMLSGPAACNAALYFPCVREVDPLRDGRAETFVPSGIIAGVIARSDMTHGVWKAPAGLETSLNGVQDLQVDLNDLENGQLNPLGINCLRSFGATGVTVWGARTLRGIEGGADEYRYLPVRRLALFLEESVDRGTRWTVFEPNDERLWAQIRGSVGTFMQGLFHQGAFQGATPNDAYYVKCDSQTTTQADIDGGNLNIVIGFAPLKPAEFVVLTIRQIAGQCPK